ncbi:hypothetical protein HPP92_006626 [Vanilla planifolia]|uniref:ROTUNDIFOLIA like 8 n=1 Tax=Vanilla planifolia TaxID=51239 RepID=A0A835RGN5_VANPL|nr:hypothetical protein HPP92_006626 [Vanilla planifolia]
MELYMDEKWKLQSKKGSRNSSSCRRDGSGVGAFLKRSSSLPERRGGAVAGAGGTQSFTSRCSNLVKEQRARFYIMRRCVTMLICWRDYP